ncbi:MAG: hypothetical protein K6F57_04845 [Candidatus Saccharibacteria bacterium]|nr:hypothetical protein [Candidatus Saccharibacteria bacterium]
MTLHIKHKITIVSLIVLFAFCITLNTKHVFAEKYPFNNTLFSDSGDWDTSAIADTDIIVDTSKINLYRAKNESGAITITGTHKNQFSYQETTDNDYIVSRETGSTCGSIKWNGPNNDGKIPANTLYDNIDAQMTFKFTRAALDIHNGQWYDFYLEISDITIRNNGTKQTKGVPTVYGCEDSFWLGGTSYRQKKTDGTLTNPILTGAKYSAEIYLKKTGTNTLIESGHKMIWGFDDIDIKDAFSSGNHDYFDPPNSIHQWAEHVYLFNGGFYSPLYVSTNHVLGKIEAGNGNATIYHEFDDNETDNVDDKRASFIVRINPAGFKFAWRGSYCGTTLIGIASTMYTGNSYIYKGNGTDSANIINNNQSITINDSSQYITFRHTITRNNEGPTNDSERYYVTAPSDGSSGPSYGSETSPQTLSSFAKNTTRTAYTKDTPSGNGFNVNLEPGQNKVLQQTLYFELSNLNNKMSNYVNTTCTLVSPNKEGTVCVKLSRPVAKFKGSVDGRIIADGGNAYLTPNPDTAGTEITEENGNFKIRFTSDITRNTSSGSDADQAGGTAKTSWNIIQTVDNTQDSSTRKPASGSTSTAELSNGQTTEVVTEADNYIYTGQLKYGETRKICAVLSYDSIVDAKNGNTSASTQKCIKVWRQNKKCTINANFEFGVKNGRNIGRIGVINSSTSKSSYTASAPGSFNQTATKQFSAETSIFARPGDSIRFVHEACAGGAYAVNNSDLNNTTYKSNYTSKGYRNDKPNSRYLFGDIIPNKETSPDPLLYKNTKSWDSSTATEGHFMSGKKNEDNEFQYYSPSNSESDTYSPNVYNNSTYSCNINSDLDINDSSFVRSHYQIPGRLYDSSSDKNCHAYTKTNSTNDVGHSIIQSLSWNEMQIINGNASHTATNDKTYTATATVKIPYNYNLQPAISSNTDTNIIYLGNNVKFNVDIYTTPRKNISFGSDSNQNTYATITKPTDVAVKYYFIKNGVKQTEFAAKNGSNELSQTDVIFNSKGQLNGTVDAGTDVSYASGGHNYGNFSVFIDDGSLSVGDRVCAYVEVSPADSHNQYMEDSVDGAGVNNIALKTTGSSSKRSTACYTIAKTPTMSVESSNAFSGGNHGFVTSRYTKQFSADGIAYPFGSWSEYGVYGKVNVNNNHGFASGATFGYATKNNGISLNEARSNNSDAAIAKNNTSICEFSTQTFANSNCSNSTSGTIGTQDIGQQSAEAFSKRIRENYTRLTSSPTDPLKDKCNDSYAYNWSTTSYTKCRNYNNALVSATEADAYSYIKIGNNNYAYLRSFINNTFDSNGINHTYIEGNAYLGAAEASHTLWASHNFNNNQQYTNEDTGESYADRNYTRVIHVTNQSGDANLIIDSDIKLGSFETENNDPELKNAGEVVNMIIIANHVEITSRVKQIDAIIIADSVNTCSYDIGKQRVVTAVDWFGRPIEYGYKYTNFNNLKNDNKAVIGENIDSNSCNEPLHFRAPVSTKKIILNRTYGAENGSNSIKRAEVFEMNPYTYLWSYNQMSRYSQAVTTFSRELPVRY